MSYVKNISKRYRNFALDIPEIEILDQGVTVIWGPSGSGKTSILRILLGLEDCETFSWNFHGREISKLSIEERKFAVVFQSYALFSHSTARENILFAARARRRPPQEANEDFQKLTHQLRLERVLDSKARHLSGGEQQRVALARALISKPDIVFLDEPFSALDEEMRDEARKLTKDILSRWNIPAVLVTHSQQDIEALASKVVRIREGRLDPSTQS